MHGRSTSDNNRVGGCNSNQIAPGSATHTSGSLTMTSASVPVKSGKAKHSIWGFPKTRCTFFAGPNIKDCSILQPT